MTDASNYTDTEYPIIDADGNIQAIHLRRDFLNAEHQPEINPSTNKPRKTYYWAGLNGKHTADLPLYRIEQLRESDLGSSNPVILVEGESATDALIAKGFAAVGTVTGAASAHSLESLRVLQGVQ